MKSTLLAFLIAPLVPGLLWAVWMLNPLVPLFAVPLGYVGAVFGLPLYWFTRRFWRVTLATCIGGGALAGVLAMLTLAVAWDGGAELTGWFISGALLFALFGAVAGAAFYGLKLHFSGRAPAQKRSQ